MSVPKISVIVPAYNAGAYLAETLASIRAQTFADFECIVIDDGSTDDTRAVMTEQARQDPRFVTISRENRGVVATRNEGIDAARGEWLAFIDADDVAHPERFALQLAALEHGGADVCSSWIRYIGHRQGIWQTPCSDAEIRAHLFFDSALAQSTVMLRKSALGNLRYRQDAILAEDYALWCDLACAGLRFTGIARALVDYRVHAGQMSRQKREQVFASAARVRAAYAAACLPESLRGLAERFAACANPAQALTPDEFCWYAAALRQLGHEWPQARPEFAEPWINALERTVGLSRAGLAKIIVLSRELPLPPHERGRLYRQIGRLLLGRTLWQKIKRQRESA